MNDYVKISFPFHVKGGAKWQYGPTFMSQRWGHGPGGPPLRPPVHVNANYHELRKFTSLAAVEGLSCKTWCSRRSHCVLCLLWCAWVGPVTAWTPLHVLAAHAEPGNDSSVSRTLVFTLPRSSQFSQANMPNERTSCERLVQKPRIRCQHLSRLTTAALLVWSFGNVWF